MVEIGTDMSWLISCDHDPCGKVAEVLTVFGGGPVLPQDWEDDDQYHYCSMKCKTEHWRRRQPAWKGTISYLKEKRS